MLLRYTFLSISYVCIAYAHYTKHERLNPWNPYVRLYVCVCIYKRSQLIMYVRVHAAYLYVHCPHIYIILQQSPVIAFRIISALDYRRVVGFCSEIFFCYQSIYILLKMLTIFLWILIYTHVLPSIPWVMYEDIIRQRSLFSKTLRCCLRQSTGPGDIHTPSGTGGIEPSLLRTLQSTEDKPPYSISVTNFLKKNIL